MGAKIYHIKHIAVQVPQVRPLPHAVKFAANHALLVRGIENQASLYDASVKSAGMRELGDPP